MRHWAARLTAAVLVAIVISATACSRAEVAQPVPWPLVEARAPIETNLTGQCVAAYDPQVDYFPDKATITEAVSFRVTYHGHYKVVDFAPRIGSHEVVRYLLVQCGTPLPAGYADARVVRVPVSRFVSTKVEVADAFARLGVVDRLVGVNSMRPIVVPEILARYRAGQIAEVGTGTHSTIELAMAVMPDLVFTFYSAFADSNIHARLWEAGVVGVPLGDHFEPTPLGRSEWIKFLALFFNAERRASEEFEGLAARYRALQQRAASVGDRPAVILGGPSSRTRWGLNGGQNYLARLIEDAGGRYVWNSDSMRSLDLADIEQIYELSAEASAWIGNATGARTLDALVDDDPRMRAFGPVARRAVFNSDKGRTSTGGYPLANESITRTDALLADVMQILHPELLPARELAFHYAIR